MNEIEKIQNTLNVLPDGRTFEVWHDIGFAIRYGPFIMNGGRQLSEHVFDWELLNIVGYEETASGPRALYEKWVDHHSESEDDPDKATVYADGHLKWDGCCNWRFLDRSPAMGDDPGTSYTGSHFCGKEGATMLLRALERVFDVVGPQIPAWDGG